MAQENDIVLVHMEDAPVSFARIEDITADAKKDWYHVKLLMLQIPLQVVTWILKNDYINGDEFFMGGKKMKLEPVKCPEDKNEPLKTAVSTNGENSVQNDETHSDEAKIISFSEMKKSKKEYEPESG